MLVGFLGELFEIQEELKYQSNRMVPLMVPSGMIHGVQVRNDDVRKNI